MNEESSVSPGSAWSEEQRREAEVWSAEQERNARRAEACCVWSLAIVAAWLLVLGLTIAALVVML